MPRPEERARETIDRQLSEAGWVVQDARVSHFTLKTNPLQRRDLDEFVACYHSENRHQRTPTWSGTNPDGCWRAYGYDELVTRDKASLDIFWLRDESLEDSANLPDPDVIARRSSRIFVRPWRSSRSCGPDWERRTPGRKFRRLSENIPPSALAPVPRSAPQKFAVTPPSTRRPITDPPNSWNRCWSSTLVAVA
ncbi:hypothetical protein BH24GEM1_BH24GEM1_12790 [soil metagenome]